jgi:ketosteroid isomerase-like protein
LAELFAEDAVVQVANMPPSEGRDAIREFYGNMFGFLTPCPLRGHFRLLGRVPRPPRLHLALADRTRGRRGSHGEPVNGMAAMRARAAAAGAAALLLAACADERPAGTEDGRELLEQRQAEFFQAGAERDADRMAELFAEDAVVQVANMPPIEGRDAIRELYGNMFGFLTRSEATPEALRISDGGDMAYGTGSTSNEFRGPEGPMRYSGKYLLVWRKLAGDWMVVAYSVSSNHQDPNGG